MYLLFSFKIKYSNKYEINTIINAKHLIVELQHVIYNENAPVARETIPFIENIGFKCIAPLFCNNGPDGDYGFIKI